MMTRMMADTTVITTAVKLACRAPSLHNSQPWQWVAGSASVELFVDPHRTVTSTDRSGREAIISCGAALDHFRIAMAAVGWDTNVERFPNPNNLDHLASTDFVSVDYVPQARRDRADAISRRRTNRLPFRPPKHWAELEPVVQSSFESDSVTLDVLGADARPRLAEASRLTEAMRRYDDDYHQELVWWTAPSRQSEGIPESALVSEADARRVDVNRRFPTDPDEWSSAGTDDQAKILVLSTPGDTRGDALRCGEALSAILLECTMAGLATCPITHITELEASRDIIRDLMSDSAVVPQVLIRVGIEPEGDLVRPPTPRRPLSEVLEIRP
ncbi:Acg family FMN-binding oxidoreductase [Mycobacterium sp.]|uniref:Acg family FMN-binding oxidoreductase n=1 Tax=Mycobacterium sp. TaxID=1785 RepID=UPI003F94FE4C